MDVRNGKRNPALFHRLVPMWKGNLVVFGALIAGVLIYFYWQVNQAHKTFLAHVEMNSEIIAGVIESNARSAVLSETVIEEIIRTFLSSSARFVDYLDNVEPFSDAELTAFAGEAGLAGIRIARAEGKTTEGPAGWFPADTGTCGRGGAVFRHLPNHHLYCLAWSGPPGDDCIVVGIAARQMERLKEQISLTHLLETMSAEAGIAYVRVESGPRTAAGPPAGPKVRLIDDGRRQVAETRLTLGARELVLGLEARRFFVRVQGLWREFFVFSAILAGFGALLSWVLFRFQQDHVLQARIYEREIARQREDAALGRAAASITHEIGNPLNAISMGLQRLKLESEALGDGEREMVDTMLSAVERTRGIITGIRRYAKPLHPCRQAVRLDRVVSEILSLYRHQCAVQKVEVTLEDPSPVPVTGDAPLLGEVVENLVKNALEAQPNGGGLKMSVRRSAGRGVFTVENGGLALAPNEVHQMLEPYFTTKTRGTGLGLSIARRIVDALGGSLLLESPAAGVLKVTLALPLATPGRLETPPAGDPPAGEA